MATGCGAHPNRYKRHDEHASGNGFEVGYEIEVPVLIVGGMLKKALRALSTLAEIVI